MSAPTMLGLAPRHPSHLNGEGEARSAHVTAYGLLSVAVVARAMSAPVAASM